MCLSLTRETIPDLETLLQISIWNGVFLMEIIGGNVFIHLRANTLDDITKRLEAKKISYQRQK